MNASAGRFDWRRFSAPSYWPTWGAIGLFWLLSRLPFRAQLAAGRQLGNVLYALLPGRRRVGATNLALALPDQDAGRHRHINRQAFQHAGMGIAETACAWFRPLDDYVDRFDMENPELLDDALARGRGVILLQAHFTTIDLPAGAMNRRWRVCGVYDEPKNPLYSAWITHRRHDYMQGMIDNRNIRAMVRHLRGGGIVWYSPDQTVGRHRGGIPTRYFDQPVLTTSGTARIAGMTDAAVLPFQPVRRATEGRYTLRFHPPLTIEHGNLEAATNAVNAVFEAQVRQHPEQYFWVHKRFRPPDSTSADPYA